MSQELTGVAVDCDSSTVRDERARVRVRVSCAPRRPSKAGETSPPLWHHLATDIEGRRDFSGRANQDAAGN